MAKKREITLEQKDLILCLELIEKLAAAVKQAVATAPKSRKYPITIDDDQDPWHPPVSTLGMLLRCRAEAEPAAKPKPVRGKKPRKG
jgi:hypothetical protein